MRFHKAAKPLVGNVEAAGRRFIEIKESTPRNCSTVCRVASGMERALHRKSVGPDAGLDARSRNRGGDWKAFAHARRKGAYRSCAAAIA